MNDLVVWWHTQPEQARLFLAVLGAGIVIVLGARGLGGNRPPPPPPPRGDAASLARVLRRSGAHDVHVTPVVGDHDASAQCWCQPVVTHRDVVNDARIWTHRRAHDVPVLDELRRVVNEQR